MKSILSTLLTVLLLGGLLVLTCPNKQDHTDALKNELNTYLNKQSSDEEAGGLAALQSAIGTGLGGLVIESMLRVDNYFIFSVGRFTAPNEERVVSVGVLNHVFTGDLIPEEE